MAAEYAIELIAVLRAISVTLGFIAGVLLVGVVGMFLRMRND